MKKHDQKPKWIIAASILLALLAAAAIVISLLAFIEAHKPCPPALSDCYVGQTKEEYLEKFNIEVSLYAGLSVIVLIGLFGTLTYVLLKISPSKNKTEPKTKRKS